MAPPPATTKTPCEELAGAARPHVMFIPSAGMGHLLPFFRFIASLAAHAGDEIDISVVTVLPTVSAAESAEFAALFASLPRLRRVDLHLLPLDASEFPAHDRDPFTVRWEALRRSAHLLGPLIAGAGPPPVSAVVTDVTLASHVIPLARDLAVPCHVLFISCATMLSLLAYTPVHLEKKNAGGEHPGGGLGDVDIPGVRRIPESCLPQPLQRDLSKLFARQFVDNGRAIVHADGLLVNTFDALEPTALAALRGGRVVPGFPPVYAVGPLSKPRAAAAAAAAGKEEEDSSSSAAAAAGDAVAAWLDGQPARSVVYVAFGNRSAASAAQNREIAAGLEASGRRFFWVLKTTVVDRDDAAAGEAGDGVLGEGFLERVRGRGVVTKAWVEQEALLRHPAVGLFLSHSGWNSVTEAAAAGVPLLAWPRGGDHRVNAMVVQGGGAGVWMEGWSWDGEDWLVTAEEIAEKVREVMDDDAVRARAARAGEEAAMAVAEGGTSYRSMLEFVSGLKRTVRSDPALGPSLVNE